MKNPFSKESVEIKHERGVGSPPDFDLRNTFRAVVFLGTVVVGIVSYMTWSFIDDNFLYEYPDTTKIASPEILIKAFEYAALPRPFSKIHTRQQGRIVRWSGPFYIHAYEENPRRAVEYGDRFWIRMHNNVLDQITKEMRFLTGLKIHNPLGSMFQKINYQIDLLRYNEKEIIDLLLHNPENKHTAETLAKTKNCFIFDAIKNYEIKQGRIYVRANQAPETAQFCLASGFAELMGFSLETVFLPNSVLSPKPSNLSGFGINDQILIRTLFDKRIKPGMKRKEVMPIVRKIIPQLVKAVKVLGARALHQ